MRQRAATGVIVAATFILRVSAPARAQAIPQDALITLERTACLGECPIYAVSINAQGTVVYDGERFVRVEGRQTDRIPVSRVAALLETAGRIGFFDLKGKYSAMVTDLPTTFVTIRANGRSKRIEDYVGAPDGLHQLEREIDEAARTLRWVRIDAETVRHMAQQGWRASNDDGIEMLRNALEYDEVDVVQALLDAGADANHGYFGSNTTPLMFVRSGAAARALLSAGAMLAVPNEVGATPLGSAVYLDPEVTQVLLNAGANPNQTTDMDGRTPLWTAACAGNIEVVQLLLAAGADPRVRVGNVSAVDCARRSLESDRASQRFRTFDAPPPFRKDFAGVIASIDRAIGGKR